MDKNKLNSHSKDHIDTLPFYDIWAKVLTFHFVVLSFVIVMEPDWMSVWERYKTLLFFNIAAMYDFLLKYLPARWANIGIALWYAVLVLAILYLLQVNEADFRYIDY